MTPERQEIRELTECNDVLENYFRNTIIPQVYLDGELKLQKFTPPAMKHFGLGSDDIGKPIGDLMVKLRFPTIQKSLDLVIESNQSIELEVQTTDLLWYQLNIQPYTKLKGNFTDGVIVTFMEITVRIKDLKIQLKLNAENAILLDTLSHDLRSPLANLVGLMELLKSVPSPDKAESISIHEMVDSSLKTIQKQLYELTEVRKEEFEHLSELEPLNFEHILHDIRIALSDRIIIANTLFSSQIHISEISFSGRKLRTILYNLLNNAVKFRSIDRQLAINVSTYREKDYFVISVKDNGIGIAEDEFERIFSKYGRLARDVDGSGIGLYLVKEIVTQAGGKIEVKSQLEEGSEFIVYLPMD